MMLFLRSIVVAALATAACVPPSGSVAPVLDGAAPGDTPIAALEADVRYLASTRLGGRASGTPGGDSAAAFLVRRYGQLGLRGAFPAPCRAEPACPAALRQRVEAGRGVRTYNVAALIVGTDSALRDQYIVVGAHYDHLGRSIEDALDPERGPVIHPGADDNASGTAAVLELARRFADRPLRRSVLVVHFGAEELGMIGSHAFVAEPPVPLAAMTVMLNLDMVGRLRGRPLIVETHGPPSIRARADSAARILGVRTTRGGPGEGRSDHGSFIEGGVPTVMLFTDFHEDYHRATDTAARIDYPGLVKVVEVAEAMVRRFDHTPF